MKNKKKLVLFLAISALIVLGLRAWDDEKLFTTIHGAKGKSNVILVQDHTGSMCSIIYHPDFNPKISLTSYSTVSLPNSTGYDGISQTSWYVRWVNGTTIRNASGSIKIKSWTAASNLLVLSSGYTDTKIKVGDWILQFQDTNTTIDDNDIENNINSQMVAQVTAKSTSGSGSSTVTNLTLNPSTIKGTPTVNNYVYYYSNNSSSYTTKIVKLYGSTLDQGAYDVAYTMDPDLIYLKWIFGVANDTQRQQVTDFSKLAYDIEYNGYLRTPPVSPTTAKALNENYPLVFNSDSTVSLLEEWNTVMKAIYPNKIANLKIDEADLTTTTTTFKYEKHKASFAGYTTPGFKIKIDAETMVVNSNVLDVDGKFGTLTVTRGTLTTTGTVAATHPAGAAIMIYNQTTSPVIDEYTPLTNLFSSLQHVDEPTGDINTTTPWTETKNGDFDNDGDLENKTGCYRYKRVFTRIQMAREALCDVITAKNKLLKVADLAAAASDVDTVLTYCNVNPDFLTRIAPFYIKVSDPDNPGSDEIMKVTAHDPATYTLTVDRHQQGTSACAHAIYSAVSTYSGARDLVRFGIFSFSSTDNPVNKMVDLNDFGQKNTNGTYKAAAYINLAILNKVDALDASGGTPLARALTYVWNYLKPNANTGVFGANYITSNWAAVNTSYGFEQDPATLLYHPKGSPMEYWCQENYAVMITDGEATEDSGNMGYGVFSQTNQKTALCGNISNDFFKFDYNRSTYPTPWGDTVNDGSEYLTDVAYFLSHQDMFPTTKIKNGTIHWDTTNKYYDSYDANTNPAADATLYDESNTDPRKQWPGNQNIKTYTVGLCLTNTVLPKAAKNGGGASFTASNYRDLSEAFLNIITSVELAQNPMTYTTYAAPKQSITGGNYGYIAHFVPRTKAMWEGHLRRFRLGDDGSFPNDIDNTAATVSVTIAGIPTNVVSFQWDAGVILNSRTTARVVYTSKQTSPGIWQRYDFVTDNTNIGAADLDVTSGQVTQVKNFIQNFNKADGINANSEYNNLYRLGETFHFNPQLVGYPLAWKANFDLSYNSFYKRYSAGGAAPRTEVVYSGANDGKLHCFKAADGTELWSYVPYAQLKNLKVPALNPSLSTAHTYFIDGKSLVKDIKVAKSDGTFYNDYRDWKTGLFFGMGIGGRSYCALDVTNPADLKVLWETDDNAETTADGRMGFTEAKPVVVDMYGGSTLKNFPAVILAGGYNAAEEKATELTVLPWQRREGKALYILNANTGALVKKFIYGTSLTETGNASSGYVETNPGFLTAMTVAPTVLDKNNDGLADVIYLAESGDYRVANNYGGGIWKINCYGNPANWVAQKIYQAPAEQTIFVSPSLAYDADYRVWVMFGTGRRSRPAEGLGTAFTNKTGQFVAFIDDNSGTVKTNADLHNAATSGDTDYTIDNSGTVKKGFFFDFHLAHEIMYEPQPLYINNQVYFMTFTPQEGAGSSGSTDDPCGGSSAVNGSHYIYQFKLTSQGNTFSIGDFLIQSGKILGFGPMGDKFIVYVGAGNAGNFKPNPGGPVTFTLENKNDTMLWKEDKK